MNYDEAINYITGTPWTTRERGHMRILELLEKLGNPHTKLKYIHIAGTNGKGSTSSMLASILQKAGYRTGLFTSPHLIKYNERMKIDGKDISDERLAKIMTRIAPIADAMAVSPSEYELLTAAAFVWYAEEKCDIIVLEVGMGGELDSTNVIPDKEAAVITAIGYDHMAILGNTLEEITSTKAGIITGSFDTVLYHQAENITKVVSDKCREMNAELHISDDESVKVVNRTLDYQEFESSYLTGTVKFPLMGNYQLKNAATVLETCKVLKNKGYNLTDEIIRSGLEECRWATRFEIVGRKPVFIIDGGHNEQGITAAVDSLKSLFPDKKVVYILGVLSDKCFDKMLEKLYSNAEYFVTLTPDSPRALGGDKLASIIQSAGQKAQNFESIRDAIIFATEKAGEDKVICSLGSLYLAGNIRNTYFEIQEAKKMYKSDIEIAQENEMLPIMDIAAKAGIDEKYVEQYGRYKAKIDLSLLKECEKEDGKLVLVTAITPTPAGEGKTTTTVGLADGMQKIGKNVVVALREPSLGPVFGVKGGAAGGGYAQVVPMEDINLHFTGDMHAIGAANNLLAAMLDNHIHQGNALNIDSRRITWRRCVDMNDRQLRFVVDGLGGKANGVPREDGYDITVASEIMAILCLSTSITDLKQRIARIIVGYNFAGEPVTAGELHAEGAMTALLKDALKPNLVQTLEHTPSLVHGGPFANIAHGCNSIMATRMALKLGDYVITEAGFGADLGAEKFLDIKCRFGGLKPSAVVMVATVRALKNHGGVAKADLNTENLEALEKGLPNLLQHVANIQNVYKLPCVVAINAFPTDTEAELELVRKKCSELGCNVALSKVWEKGGEGGIELANEVVRLCEAADENGAPLNKDFSYSYELDMSIEEKLNAIATKIYHADGVDFTSQAKKDIANLTKLGFDKVPICVAKTQYSFSDDQKLLGAPRNFRITVRSMKVSAGAGFIVALTGDIMTMPGLPKVPAAEKIDVDENGVISGLF